MLWDRDGLRIAADAEMPVYRQIAERIRSMVLQGQLQPGARLPAVRKLARNLRVAPATVQRAYSELHSHGLLEARAGSGTIVADTLKRTMGSAILTNLLDSGPFGTYERVSESIGLRSFASAVPDPEVFHADELIAEINDLRHASPWLWYYGPAGGAPELQRQICRMLAARGIECNESHVVVTNGSTGALALLCDTIESSGTVLLEEPGFMMANELLRLKKLKGIGIPSGQFGIDLQLLEQAARENPGAMLIVFPTFHSATGGVLPPESRQTLIDICRRNRITVVEVDRNRQIAFEVPPPPLASMDPDVIYVDSFSYSVCPGVRTGYVKAPQTLIPRLLEWSRATTNSTPMVLQVALSRYLAKGRLQAQVSRTLPEYLARRNALMQALRLSMPEGTTWTEPAGGFACWVSLPAGGRYEGLYEEAIEKGLAFTPSSLLMLNSDPSKLRLAFGRQDSSAIHEAVQVLARLVRERL